MLRHICSREYKVFKYYSKMCETIIFSTLFSDRYHATSGGSKYIITSLIQSTIIIGGARCKMLLYLRNDCLLKL